MKDQHNKMLQQLLPARQSAAGDEEYDAGFISTLISGQRTVQST
jgi:hypothetical protein